MAVDNWASMRMSADVDTTEIEPPKGRWPKPKVDRPTVLNYPGMGTSTPPGASLPPRPNLKGVEQPEPPGRLRVTLPAPSGATVTSGGDEPSPLPAPATAIVEAAAGSSVAVLSGWFAGPAPAGEGATAQVMVGPLATGPAPDDDVVGLGRGATVVFAQAGGGNSAIYGLMGAPGGPTGNFGASSLASAGAWDVNPNLGNFSWSTSLNPPPVPGGLSSPATFTYSSQSVDAMTSSALPQASNVGLGWSNSMDMYIEREFWDCVAQGQFNPSSPEYQLWYPGSLCWHTDNASIVMGGRASPLIRVGVPANPTEFRLKDNPGWRVWRYDFQTTNEYWVVQTPEGRTYNFGTTDQSRLKVPVGYDDGAACAPQYAGTGMSCHPSLNPFRWLPYQWKLNAVSDTNGNWQHFEWSKQTYYYGFNQLAQVILTYDRDALLEYVLFGYNTGPGAGTWQTQIDFTYGLRCNGSWCPLPIHGTQGSPSQLAAAYPDVPTDLMYSCEVTVTYWCGTNVSPTRFSIHKLSAATTYAWVDGAWRPVEKLDFTHEFQGSGALKLWLRSIVRTAWDANGQFPQSLPIVRFDSFSSLLQNSYFPDIKMWRVDHIWDELGGSTRVTYGQSHPCNGQLLWGNFSNQGNQTNCWWAQSGGLFNRWLVTEVKRRDRVGATGPTAAGDAVTKYWYEGTPAWGYQKDPNIETTARGWYEWRGYQSVAVFQGNAAYNTNQPATRYRYFRGLSNNGPGGGVVNVTDSDGANPVEDHDWLAGKVYEARTYGCNGCGPLEATRTLYSPWGDLASQDFLSDPQWRARFVAPNWIHTTQWHSGGSRTISEEVFVDGNNGAEVYRRTNGDPSATGDERCVYKYWSWSWTAWLIAPQSDAVFNDFACTSHRRVNYYWTDGQAAHTSAPIKGNITKVQRLDGSGGGVDNPYTYDLYGRQTSATDGRNLKKQTVTYTPAVGLPTQISTSVINPTTSASYGMNTVTLLERMRGLPTKVTDHRGQVTEIEYDWFGRTTKVWGPTEPRAGVATAEFTYSVPIPSDYAEGATRSPVVVRSDTLVDKSAGAKYRTTAVVLDGLQRPRETQEAIGVSGGITRVRSEFDDAGRLTFQSDPVWSSATIGTLVTANSIAGPGRSVSYDGANRVTQDRRVSSAGATLRTTTSAYNQGGINTVVTPPNNNGASTRAWTDGLGRTKWVDAYKTASVFARTASSFNAAGDLLTVTDPGGNVTTNTVDWLGRRTRLVDPDQGTFNYTYDANSNLASQSDAKGDTITFDYDGLDRLTAQRDGATTLTSFGYHSGQNTINNGLASTSSRIVAGSSYTTNFTGYDARGRLTAKSIVIPAVEGALAGTYAYGYTYDEGDNLKTMTYPTAGTMPGETVTATYEASRELPLGLSSNYGGASTYVFGTAYDNLGRRTNQFLTAAQAGSIGAQTGVWKQWTYNTDEGRLASQFTKFNQAAPLHELVYGYDANGNITSTDESAFNERWCYTYDSWDRLTRAWTTTANTACTNFNNNPTGPAPYKAEWTFNTTATDIGNLLSVNETLDQGAAITKTYGYSPTRPHQVTSITRSGLPTDTFAYDNNGAQTTRTRNGVTSTLTWDKLHKLTSSSIPVTKLRNKGTGTCLQTPNNNGSVQYSTATCSTAVNQQWEQRPLRTAISLVSRDIGNRMCMDLAGASTADGAVVVQYQCHGMIHQSWTLTAIAGNPANGYQIISPASGKCLNLETPTTTTQRTCNTATNSQVWYLDTVTAITNTNIYDANGDALIVTEPNGDRHLFLDSQDVLQRQSGLYTYRRYYLAGDHIANRDYAGYIHWTTTNHQGTLAVTVESNGNYRRQRYTPYGNPLATIDQFDVNTRRGFLDAYENDPTGLVTLGARHYDPTNHIFISVDPATRVSGYEQRARPLAYGNWNPVNMIDKTGLFPIPATPALGVAAHRIIELYYLAEHVGSLIEYRYRADSGRVGVIDIVDPVSHQFYEIKPMSASGILAGIAQIFLRMVDIVDYYSNHPWDALGPLVLGRPPLAVPGSQPVLGLHVVDDYIWEGCQCKGTLVYDWFTLLPGLIVYALDFTPNGTAQTRAATQPSNGSVDPVVVVVPPEEDDRPRPGPPTTIIRAVCGLLGSCTM